MARVLLLSGAAVMAVVTACSSSSSGGGGGYGAGGGGGSSQAASSPAKAAAAVTISMNGSALTGPNGHTLYMNTVDTVSDIKCVGACASEWPPVTGTPKAGAGVDGTKLGTATRPDGTKQVTLDGHPLYEFDEDKAPGDKHGDGLADEGGKWHVATLAGAGAPASGPSTPDMSSSGSGYHY
jgi:predicted lipoprotein with Yx(FWY)xxD motif